MRIVAGDDWSGAGAVLGVGAAAYGMVYTHHAAMDGCRDGVHFSRDTCNWNQGWSARKAT